MPFENGSFDLVYTRQAMHHAKDIFRFGKEVERVLKPGGCFLATREHVISSKSDLSDFLSRHSLASVYKEENAFTVSEYVSAIKVGGMKVRAVLGSYESAINYYPMTYENWLVYCQSKLARRLGKNIVEVIARDSHRLGREILRVTGSTLSNKDNSPGRMMSFLARKV